MNPISVVIIAKNEAEIIAGTIRSVQSVSDDIIVVDSGSTDGTQAIARGVGARVIETTWDGFGQNKNKGIAVAKYDWVLSIDSDEMPDERLVKTLDKTGLLQPGCVYKVDRKSFFGNKMIRHGEWGKDTPVRLFERANIQWNDAKVHEQLQLPPGIKVQLLDGYLLHYTMKDMADYATKMTRYALLNAERYLLEGKRAGWVKRNVSSRFSFIQNYIFKLGFLDGREGYLIAKMTCYYTFLKYARLYELYRAQTRQ